MKKTICGYFMQIFSIGGYLCNNKTAFNVIEDEHDVTARVGNDTFLNLICNNK